jgi:signal transduction histidine kinase
VKFNLSVAVSFSRLSVAAMPAMSAIRIFREESIGDNSDARSEATPRFSAISKAIVELHGGVINAYSDGLSRGSTFTVELPLGPRVSSIRSPFLNDATADT